MQPGNAQINTNSLIFFSYKIRRFNIELKPFKRKLSNYLEAIDNLTNIDKNLIICFYMITYI